MSAEKNSTLASACGKGYSDEKLACLRNFNDAEIECKRYTKSFWDYILFWR